MPKKIQLDVSRPCHEDWNQMTDSEKGKFCNSCQKHVIDFTGMNDAQLIAFFRKPTNGSVCGRFMSDQLQRDIILPKKRIPWFKYFFQFALPAFVFSLKAKGQTSSSGIIGDTVMAYNNCHMPATNNKLPDLLIKSRTINGRVVDANENPVPYASITIGDRGMGIAADSNGYFKFDKSWLSGSSLIQISSVGFEPKMITTNTILNDKELIVHMNETKVLSEVELSTLTFTCTRIVAGGVMSIKTNVIDKWEVKNLIPWTFKKDTIKVYPNPVPSGNPVTIEVLKSGKQKTTVELFSMAGQVVYATQMNMSSNAWKAALPLPALTPGTYVIRVNRGEKEKSYSTKIIIQ